MKKITTPTRSEKRRVLLSGVRPARFNGECEIISPMPDGTMEVVTYKSRAISTDEAQRRFYNDVKAHGQPVNRAGRRAATSRIRKMK